MPRSTAPRAPAARAAKGAAPTPAPAPAAASAVTSAGTQALTAGEPTYFTTAAHFGRWLRRHGATATALIVGFHKVGSGTPSMSWPESVDRSPVRRLDRRRAQAH